MSRTMGSRVMSRDEDDTKEVPLERELSVEERAWRAEAISEAEKARDACVRCLEAVRARDVVTATTELRLVLRHGTRGINAAQRADAEKAKRGLS